ncbi:MAG: hypothetical protein Q8K11_10660 [Phenylobacterium sp.]|uniref:hypothetical protein n=1 Tax=Phenylobacterium sp. TaxID=1871053 RepID=UPI0027317653|nr:hypothetical protein [Phenylobacterium sp.]MDP2010629.1 hypothetical protein [Phenylobacterium sp.]
MDITDLSSWDTPLFPVAVAAKAAMVEPGTLRMWFQRGRINLHQMDAAFVPAEIPGKTGMTRLLSLRTVLRLAAAAPLVRRGVDVTQAYAAAGEWTHYGAGWNGVGECPREPAALYAAPAWTFLVHHEGPHARVVAVEHTNGLAFDFADLFPAEHPAPVAPAIVLLNKVDQIARGVCGAYLQSAGA